MAFELFVNGTLMRGLALHRNLDGAQFLGEARSAPIYRLYSTDDRHPGMFEGGVAVAGEVYLVPDDAWRRVVPSPLPQAIVEIDEIAHLAEAGYVVIACGGGGIPVLRDEQGDLQGVEAMIDKDLASSMLARALNAGLVLISTGVPRVAID